MSSNQQGPNSNMATTSEKTPAIRAQIFMQAASVVGVIIIIYVTLPLVYFIVSPSDFVYLKVSSLRFWFIMASIILFLPIADLGMFALANMTFSIHEAIQGAIPKLESDFTSTITSEVQALASSSEANENFKKVIEEHSKKLQQYLEERDRTIQKHINESEYKTTKYAKIAFIVSYIIFRIGLICIIAFMLFNTAQQVVSESSGVIEPMKMNLQTYVNEAVKASISKLEGSLNSTIIKEIHTFSSEVNEKFKTAIEEHSKKLQQYLEERDKKIQQDIEEHNKTIREYVDKKLSAVKSSELRIALQGGDVERNVERMLAILSEQDLLRMKTAEAKAGETVSDVYQRVLNLPKHLWSSELQRVIQWGSKEKDLEKMLVPGQLVSYPDVKIQPFTVTKIFDISEAASKAELERVTQQWGEHVRLSPVREGRYITAELDNWHVKMVTNSQDALHEAIEAIQAWQPTELGILTTKPHDTSAPSPPLFQFSVRFEGGNLSGNVTRVLESLVNLNIVQTAEARFQHGDTPDSIYRDRLGIPVLLSALASKINGKDYSKGYRVGDVIKYPDVRFREYTWFWRFDTRKPAQLQRQQNILKHWNVKSLASTLPVYKEQRKVGDGVVDMLFAGYELTIQVPNPEALAAAREALAAVRTSNVVLDFPSDSRSQTEVHSASLVDPDKFFDMEVEAESRDVGTEASIGCYIKRCNSWESLKIARIASQSVRVIVLDHKVDRDHPDLSSALVDGDNPGPDLPLPYPEGKRDKQLISFGQFKKEDHGTHLAGIVAGRLNGYGMLGVNPGALIESVDWSYFSGRTRSELVEKLEKLEKKAFRNLPIILFASTWKLELKSGKTEVSTEGDLDDDYLASHIRHIKPEPLLVASAGQYQNPTETPDDAPNGTDLATKPRRAPWNLAHMPNVIIVTSCEECYGLQARRTPGANYSWSKVHVAAPGGKVYSTLRSKKFGMSGGTSQSTALVAGIASAMVTAYDYYTQAWMVKRRLQVTSYPMPDAEIATGAVDFRAALLDPKKSWRIKESEQCEGEAAREAAPYCEFKPKAWCSEILLFKEGSAREALTTSQIRRLLRREDGWVIYTVKQSGRASDEVQRRGPGELLGELCLALEDGTELPLEESKDIILADNASLPSLPVGGGATLRGAN